MAKIKGLYSVLKHVPEKLQRLGNRLGDNVSRKISLADLDNVSEKFDRMAKEVKKDVESLYQGSHTSESRKARALELDVRGGAFFGDNVGKVCHVGFYLGLCEIQNERDYDRNFLPTVRNHP